MRKIYLSFLTLLFAIVALGTTTYAWFTTGGTVAIGAFEMNVVSGTGIEVGVSSLTAEAPAAYYVSKLPEGILYNVVTGATDNKLPDNWKFSAVTPEIKNNTITKFNTIQVKDGIVSTTAAEGGYIGYKLYIKSEVDGEVEVTDLAISHTKTAVSSWTSGIDYLLNDAANTEIKSTTKVSYDIFSTVRLAFVDVTSTTKVMTIYEQDTVNPTGTSADGYAAGNSVGFCPDYTSGGPHIGMSFIYGSKYSLTELKAPTTNTYSTTTKFVTNDSGNLTTADNYSVEVQKGVAKVVEVYVWIEGWDAECVNAILSQGINISYTLKLADA